MDELDKRITELEAVDDWGISGFGKEFEVSILCIWYLSLIVWHLSFQLTELVIMQAVNNLHIVHIKLQMFSGSLAIAIPAPTLFSFVPLSLYPSIPPLSFQRLKDFKVNTKYFTDAKDEANKAKNRVVYALPCEYIQYYLAQ